VALWRKQSADSRSSRAVASRSRPPATLPRTVEILARMLAADPRSEAQETAAMMQALQARAG
jgi:hypothetical protein